MWRIKKLLSSDEFWIDLAGFVALIVLLAILAGAIYLTFWMCYAHFP